MQEIYNFYKQIILFQQCSTIESSLVIYNMINQKKLLNKIEHKSILELLNVITL